MFSALKRVFEVTGCATQIELANLLKIGQSSVSDVKRRGSIPPDWLVKLLRLKGVNPDWIINGEGAKYLVPSPAEPITPHVASMAERRPPEECTAQELVNELVRRALRNPHADTPKTL